MQLSLFELVLLRERKMLIFERFIKEKREKMRKYRWKSEGKRGERRKEDYSRVDSSRKNSRENRI